jgi:hypothetical protein
VGIINLGPRRITDSHSHVTTNDLCSKRIVRNCDPIAFRVISARREFTRSEIGAKRAACRPSAWWGIQGWGRNRNTFSTAKRMPFFQVCVPCWVHPVDWISIGVLVAPLAVSCHRVNVEEAPGAWVVVARPQIIQAQIRVVLFAATARPDAVPMLACPQA